jgi:outer membrane lipoprotein SlyB
MKLTLAISAGLFSLVLGGCATTGSGSPSAKPVLYPNTTLERVGQAKAQEEVEVCMGKATSAGLTPDEKTNAVGRGAVKGAAVGGMAGAVGAIVRGKGVEGVVERGAGGAVVGGSVGAVAGSFHEKPSSTYRHFVQRCLKDKGFDVIGWN